MTHNSTWKTAIQVTLHCLLGCSIGEILGLLIGTHFGWHQISTVLLSIGLAFFFGYILAAYSLLKIRMPWRKIVPLVVASETISIMTMEIVDNSVMLLVPTSMTSGLSNPVFWISMVLALAVGFIVTVPVNKYLLSKGHGHALMHDHH